MPMNKTTLKQAGIDYDRGVARFLGDEDLYENVLTSFLEDTMLDRAQAAHDAGNMSELFACVHELKGVSGNLDMTEVYRTSSALTELLRVGVNAMPERIAQAFAETSAAYALVKKGIRAAMED